MRDMNEVQPLLNDDGSPSTPVDAVNANAENDAAAADLERDRAAAAKADAKAAKKAAKKAQ